MVDLNNWSIFSCPPVLIAPLLFVKPPLEIFDVCAFACIITPLPPACELWPIITVALSVADSSANTHNGAKLVFLVLYISKICCYHNERGAFKCTPETFNQIRSLFLVQSYTQYIVGKIVVLYNVLTTDSSVPSVSMMVSFIHEI